MYTEIAVRVRSKLIAALTIVEDLDASGQSSTEGASVMTHPASGLDQFDSAPFMPDQAPAPLRSAN